MLSLSKKYTNILYLVLLIISIFYMLIQPNVVVNSIKETLSVFTTTILPTLFPFILCSQIIIMLGGAKIIGFPLMIITKVLGLNPEVSGAYAASLIGGYPAGAASLNTLYKKGCVKGNYLVSMLLCSNCGPMFVIGTVGTVLLDSYGAGIVILLAHIAGGIGNAILFKSLGISEKQAPYNKKVVEQDMKNNSIFAVLDKCIVNTAGIMIKIFTYMAIFKLIGDAFFLQDNVNNVTMAEVVFRGVLELLDGCINASKLNFYTSAVIICGIISFGGLSAVFQSISVSKAIPYNKMMFIVGKISHCIISGFLCYCFIGFVPLSTAVYNEEIISSITAIRPVPNIMLYVIFACVLYVIYRSLWAVKSLRQRK